ncbi:hypothetical protein DL96DRAFT_1707415 [Flagelloscypha sp. PMI_526]|nr:hypothetical protein DL96DRAFT_1707415 [Flagelloscypha sp. PMI_526]
MNHYSQQGPSYGPSYNQPYYPPTTSTLQPERQGFLEQKNLPHAPQSKKSFQPLSAIILLIWVGYIIAMIWLLEKASSASPTSGPPSWSYTRLPIVLLTLFAQAHTAITSMHLARIAISSLSSPRTAPNTWVEVFWMADRAWSGPVGIVVALKDSLFLKAKLSLTFLLFAFTCLVALATPAVLSRAFPIQNIPFITSTSIQPKTFNAAAMQVISGYIQQGTGLGSWGTGLSAYSLLSSSIFIPSDLNFNKYQSSADPTDLFIAGNIGPDANGTLPGLHVQGSCSVVPPGSGVPDATGATSASNLTTLLNPYCSSKFTIGFAGAATIGGVRDITLLIADCATLGFSSLKTEPTFSEGYLLYSYSETGIANSGQGLIHCTSNTTTGTAYLQGANGTFTDFQYSPLFNASTSSNGGEPLTDPLAAAFYGLVDPQQTSGAPMKEAVQRGFGLVAVPTATGQAFDVLTPDIVANRMWSAVAHNLAAIGTLSWRDTVAYNITKPVFYAVHVHASPYREAAYALLGLWAVLLLAITGYGYRRSAASGLDSYAASWLVARQGHDLVVREPLSDPAGNTNLKLQFEARI